MVHSIHCNGQIAIVLRLVDIGNELRRRRINHIYQMQVFASAFLEIQQNLGAETLSNESQME